MIASNPSIDLPGSIARPVFSWRFARYSFAFTGNLRIGKVGAMVLVAQLMMEEGLSQSEAVAEARAILAAKSTKATPPGTGQVTTRGPPPSVIAKKLIQMEIMQLQSVTSTATTQQLIDPSTTISRPPDYIIGQSTGWPTVNPKSGQSLGVCLLNAGGKYVNQVSFDASQMAYAGYELYHGDVSGAFNDYVSAGLDVFAAGWNFGGDVWDCYGLPHRNGPFPDFPLMLPW